MSGKYKYKPRRWTPGTCKRVVGMADGVPLVASAVQFRPIKKGKTLWAVKVTRGPEVLRTYGPLASRQLAVWYVEHLVYEPEGR